MEHTSLIIICDSHYKYSRLDHMPVNSHCGFSSLPHCLDANTFNNLTFTSSLGDGEERRRIKKTGGRLVRRPKLTLSCSAEREEALKWRLYTAKNQ